MGIALTFWILVFIVSLAVMLKGADWFLDSAEKIGLAAGLSPFIVGVVIVGLGTSLPELISSFAAVIQGVPEIVVANAVGSNIANILLVIGLSAIVGKTLSVHKSLIDLDIPLLAISTLLFFGVAYDGSITLPESVLLVVGYGIYLAYTLRFKEDTPHEDIHRSNILDGDGSSAQEGEPIKESGGRRVKITTRDIVILFAGAVGLIVGAKYLVEAVIASSGILGIGAGAISLFAIAFGTSLPEVIVSVKAALLKKPEVALGNIFGSNVFNLLVVVGLPGLFTTLSISAETLSLGLATLLIATFIFVISGISRRIHIWEGLMYVLVYVVFVGKLFNLF